jgi:hypothetical protein
MNDNIYSLYKPFRNKISKYYNLDQCLYLVWAYSRNLLFNLPFPQDIEVLTGFNTNENVNIRRVKGISEFMLEFLAKEFMINCQNISPNKSILKREEFGEIVKYTTNELYNNIENLNRTETDLLLDFNRKIHSQLKGQQSFERETILRYYKIFSDDKLNLILQNKLGLNAYQLFSIAFIFFIWTSKYYKSKLPFFISDNPELPKELFATFLSIFSITIDEAKDLLNNYQQVNEDLFYSYNPLYATPIILQDDTFFCPNPLSIYWIIKEGVYYQIVDEIGFSDAFGHSFEKYIGEVLHKCCNNNISILPEAIYDKPEKRTTDWLLVDNNSVMFVECKTKRLTLNSKTKLDLNLSKGILNDLKILAKEIRKIYTTYLDFTDNKYPKPKFDSTKNTFLTIVTLEDWFIYLNPLISNKLNELVQQSFIEKQMDINLIAKYPYTIFSAKDFEREIQIINSIGIAEYFSLLYNKEYQKLNEIRSKTKFVQIFDVNSYDIFNYNQTLNNHTL